MAIAHISIGKIAYVGCHVACLAFFALDPSIKVAYIGLAGVALTNLTALALVYVKLRTGQKEVAKMVDGKLDQYINVKGDLAHAEGRREGVEATQDRQDEHDKRRN
jgi:hypothetical protein